MSFSGAPPQYEQNPGLKPGDFDPNSPGGIYTGSVAPPPTDTYQGGYSASQGGEYHDPANPAWLQENPVQQMAPQQPQYIDGQAPKEGMCQRIGPKFFACLCYLFGIVGAIIAIIVEKRDAYILANAWQSVFVGIPCIIICLCFSWFR